MDPAKDADGLCEKAFIFEIYPGTYFLQIKSVKQDKFSFFESCRDLYLVDFWCIYKKYLVELFLLHGHSALALNILFQGFAMN